MVKDHTGRKACFETPYCRAQVTLFKAASGMMAKARLLLEVQSVGMGWSQPGKTLLLRGLQRLREDAELKVRRGKEQGTQGQS